MELWHALVFGIVEGISEFLPISSTGHLILTAKILGLAQTDFLKSFEISIQLGAILAVIVFYRKSFMIDWEVWKRVLAAFIPTAILGFVLYKLVKKILLGNPLVVVWALLVGGVILIIFELFHKEKKDSIQDIRQLPFSKAIFIGLIQSLAMIPGVSRSASTIIGGLMAGLQRKTIVEFSFLLAVPTMLAATGLDLVKSVHSFSMDQMSFLAVGFASSFVVALLSIKFLLLYVQKNNFILFGVYRIAVALVFLKLFYAN